MECEKRSVWSCFDRTFCFVPCHSCFRIILRIPNMLKSCCCVLKKTTDRNMFSTGFPGPEKKSCCFHVVFMLFSCGFERWERPVLTITGIVCKLRICVRISHTKFIDFLPLKTKITRRHPNFTERKLYINCMNTSFLSFYPFSFLISICCYFRLPSLFIHILSYKQKISVYATAC